MDGNSNEIVGMRVYSLELPDGSTAPVTITIDKPRISEKDGGDWSCRMTLCHPSRERSVEVSFADSVHALLGALGLAQLEADHLMSVHGSAISYIEPGYHDLWPLFDIRLKKVEIPPGMGLEDFEP